MASGAARKRAPLWRMIRALTVTRREVALAPNRPPPRPDLGPARRGPRSLDPTPARFAAAVTCETKLRAWLDDLPPRSLGLPRWGSNSSLAPISWLDAKGPTQAIVFVEEIVRMDPGLDAWSRKILNTINDMDLKGPCPFILPSPAPCFGSILRPRRHQLRRSHTDADSRNHRTNSDGSEAKTDGACCSWRSDAPPTKMPDERQSGVRGPASNWLGGCATIMTGSKRAT